MGSSEKNTILCKVGLAKEILLFIQSHYMVEHKFFVLRNVIVTPRFCGFFLSEKILSIIYLVCQNLSDLICFW